MMRGWWLLPLVAAGCTTGPVPIAHTPSAAEQACTTEAEQDPAVKQQLGIAAGRLDWQWRNEALMKQAKQDAITRCLRARGLAPRGGVERPQS